MKLQDLIQTGNYAVVNAKALHKIFPKYVPENKGKLLCFHFSKADDPSREGVHRLLIAPECTDVGADALGRFSPVPTFGPKLIHIRYNNRRGLDFHVLPYTSRENGNCPLRALKIEKSMFGNSHCFTIIGETQEGRGIQIAYFSITGVLSTHKENVYAQV